MMLGLSCNNHSAVRYLRRHLMCYQTGKEMDTHSDDLYVTLLGAETGTVRDGMWADKGSQPQRPGDS